MLPEDLSKDIPSLPVQDLVCSVAGESSTGQPLGLQSSHTPLGLDWLPQEVGGNRCKEATSLWTCGTVDVMELGEFGPGMMKLGD